MDRLLFLWLLDEFEVLDVLLIMKNCGILIIMYNIKVVLVNFFVVIWYGWFRIELKVYNIDWFISDK